MSSWGNNDNSANVPLWAAETVNLEPTRTNTDLLFDNTTANTFVGFEGADIGVFGVDAGESSNTDSTLAHSGWVLRTEGTGGRSGRVTQEVLVALSEVIGDSDTIYTP